MSTPGSFEKLLKNLGEKARGERGDIRPAIELLEVEMAPGGLVPPDDDVKVWRALRAVLDELLRNGLIWQSIEVTRWFYDQLCELQVRNGVRYHKGSPTHQAALFYLSVGFSRFAFWFFSLAFVEDVLLLGAEEARKAPAARALQLHLNQSRAFLDSLAGTVLQERERDDRSQLWWFPEIGAVRLARSGKLPRAFGTAMAELPLNHTLVQLLSRGLTRSRLGSQEKGKRLEYLASYLLLTLPGVRIVPNVRSPDSETDLVVIQEGGTGSYLVDALGRAFIVECKNWDGPVGTAEVNHFAAKIRFHRCHCGVLFARNGLTGKKNRSGIADAGLTRARWFLQDGCSVLVVDKGDVESLAEGTASIGELLLKKHEDLRFRLAT